MKGYYFITDTALSKAGNLADVESAVSAGVRIIQYRQKEGDSGALYSEALEIKQMCKGVTLIINDRVDIALAVDADGVHIGQSDLPYDVTRRLIGHGRIIGFTVHTLQEAKIAEEIGADYLGVSPIYTTSTKIDAGAACGTELITEVKKHCKIPVVAIGGINHENAPDVVGAGADMICAISAVVAADDPGAEISKFQLLFDKL